MLFRSTAIRTCSCAINEACLSPVATPLARNNTTPKAGRTSNKLILTPNPQLYNKLPIVYVRRWYAKMAAHRKKTAKQSLKFLSRKILCIRFERTSIGKIYGGACQNNGLA